MIFYPAKEEWRRSAVDTPAPYLFPSKISFRLKYLLYTQRYVHSPYDFSLKCLSQLRYGRHIECSYSHKRERREHGKFARQSASTEEKYRRAERERGRGPCSHVLHNIASVIYGLYGVPTSAIKMVACKLMQHEEKWRNCSTLFLQNPFYHYPYRAAVDCPMYPLFFLLGFRWYD